MTDARCLREPQVEDHWSEDLYLRTEHSLCGLIYNMAGTVTV
jgi:hypothetical protein